MGIDVNLLHFSTGDGKQILLSVFDIGAHDGITETQLSYFTGSDAAILMLEIGNLRSYKAFKDSLCWYDGFRSKAPDAPVVVCYNRFELETMNPAPQIKSEYKYMPYSEISVKYNMNLMDPITKIIEAVLQSRSQDMALIDTVLQFHAQNTARS